jgi:cytochrome c-type biogenesis protein CcmH/NrfF
MSRIAAVIALLLALAAPAVAAGAEPRTSLPDVEDEVMCVSCKVPLNIAESPQAYRERELIRSLVDQGLTKAQIKDRLVAEYGSNVLALPESDDGIGLAAYLVPIAVVLALLAVGAVLLPRWRRRARLPTTPGAPAGAGATDLELRRLEDDLQRYDRR